MKETGYIQSSHTYFPSQLILLEGEYAFYEGRDEGNRKSIIVFRSGVFVYASPMKKNESVPDKITRIKERFVTLSNHSVRIF